jgi:hypothetical protein
LSRGIEVALKSYRIYALDQNDKIVTGLDAECDGDDAAFAWAETKLGRNARAEIWEGRRCVGKLLRSTVPAERPSGPSP